MLGCGVDCTYDTTSCTGHCGDGVANGDEDDEYRLEGDVYDFEDLVRDELMLSLPIAPLCGPDCEGLVAEAGTGLNTDLSEDERGENSPFSVLKDLLDTGD